MALEMHVRRAGLQSIVQCGIDELDCGAGTVCRRRIRKLRRIPLVADIATCDSQDAVHRTRALLLFGEISPDVFSDSQSKLQWRTGMSIQPDLQIRIKWVCDHAPKIAILGSQQDCPSLQRLDER
ncbi:type II secretion system domain protein [Burkholderia pseudomallei]|nr:type II secretion system domain protein [Burkholderia pseudomallei]